MSKESLLKKLTSVLKDGIHVVDGDGITLLYNRKMSVIENRVVEEVVGKNVIEQGADDRNRDLLKTLRTGLPQVNQIYSGVNKFGNCVVTNNSVWPITENGKLVGAVKIAVDITEIRGLHDKVLGITKDINQLAKKEVLKDGGSRCLIADLVGESKEMEEVKRVAKLASQCDSNVMIVGASGTGKELIAQSIHNESGRRHKPLIAENCAAIPDNLLESTFFGTMKGGFTGAVDRPGLFQMADGGTLVLDEINSLPVSLQAKLLRALQEGAFRPVGASQMVHVDVRVIAISNEDPELLIQAGKLRSDLFYRLSVIDIFVPPLVEREGDLELLTGYFLEQFCSAGHKELDGLDDEVMRAFANDPWQGNVRELRNVLECGVNLTEEGGTIHLENLPNYFVKHHRAERTIPQAAKKAGREICRGGTSGVSLGEYMTELEYSLVKDALKENGGNVSKAAESLGITRQALQHKLRKMGL